MVGWLNRAMFSTVGIHRRKYIKDNKCTLDEKDV